MKARKYKAFRAADRNWRISPGDYFINCGWNPCLCISRDAGGDEISGKSLVTGQVTYCSLRYCGPTKISKRLAERYARKGLPQPFRNKLEEFYRSQWGAGRKVWW